MEGLEAAAEAVEAVAAVRSEPVGQLYEQLNKKTYCRIIYILYC